MKGCKVIIKSSFLIPEHPCKRSLWKDEYCKVHHPESYCKRSSRKRKYKYSEIIKQEYTENNCKFSGGFVENHATDSMYIRLEKDGVQPLIMFLRPDEVACIGWICTGMLWSKEMMELPEKESHDKP